MCGRDGVAGDVIITSRRGCLGSVSRRTQQRASGLQARRARVERKREKLEAWKTRIKSLEHELMLWERMKECKMDQAFPLKKKGTWKKYGGEGERREGDCMEVEDEDECRRKLDEKRKKIQKELREVERLSHV